MFGTCVLTLGTPDNAYVVQDAALTYSLSSEDLRGKTLGLGRPGSADYSEIVITLGKHFKMQPGKDYRVISFTGEPDRCGRRRPDRGAAGRGPGAGPARDVSLMRGIGRRIRSSFGMGSSRVAIRPQLAWYWRWLINLAAMGLVAAVVWWVVQNSYRITGFNAEEARQQLAPLADDHVEPAWVRIHELVDSRDVRDAHQFGVVGQGFAHAQVLAQGAVEEGHVLRAAADAAAQLGGVEGGVLGGIGDAPPPPKPEPMPPPPAKPMMVDIRTLMSQRYMV